MSILIGKLAIFISRMLGNRGTDVGGRVALRFNKKVFSKLAKNIDTVILVTGTNGKSTITNVLASILDSSEYNTIDNRTGANMYTGILSAMVEKYKFFGNKTIKYAVFEVDEGNVPKVLAEFDDAFLVVNNFFQDQLDRYLDISTLVEKIDNAIKEDTKLVLNVDDPYCMTFSKYNYVGFGLDKKIGSLSEDASSVECPQCKETLNYIHNYYAHLGQYKCQCGFEHQEPKYTLEEINNGSIIVDDVEYIHHLKGQYNTYNLLAAISVAQEAGLKKSLIQEGLKNYHSQDGRMQEFDINGSRVYLNLVKNPAGMNMTLQEVPSLNIKNIAIILNDYDGDGNDVSWIWDVDFESLLDLDIDNYFVSGTRAYDMAIRLQAMGVASNDIIVNNLFASLSDIVCSKDAIIVSSYTSLNDAKNELIKKEAK
ncbi:MAG: MurT ligase domain-containing protein [Erysipelotrichales bacterium]